ncbi:glycosyl transferase [Gemmatimonadetes bacterium T265]|nr:glycosyl transferase [Gemmatimonadetes bacterium T265]
MSDVATGALAAAQATVLVRVLWRLLPGLARTPAVAPLVDPADARWAHVAAAGHAPARVTVLVATLNEAARLGPCLDGLARQGAPLAEVLVVDSRSTDGTREIVAAAAAHDPRVRLLTDPALPPGWVGKVWALEHGLRHATGDWVLGVDADTAPAPGMVAAVVAAAAAYELDVVSFAPRFAGQSAAERLLQPAMLATLVYRLGAPTPRPRTPGDVLANGQCFLARRALLVRYGGYAPARASWADDVALARHLMRRGARVGFLDGARLYDVRAYASVGEAWQEWGRSFDLADASAPARQALDLAVVTLAMGAPPLAAAGALAAAAAGWRPGAFGTALVVVNLALLAVRLGVLAATRGSYARRGAAYWCSPLADPAATARLWLSTLRRPRAWRGRAFALGAR